MTEEQLIAAVKEAVRQALEGVTVTVDKATLGYLAAEAINENRLAAGKVSLEL